MYITMFVTVVIIYLYNCMISLSGDNKIALVQTQKVITATYFLCTFKTNRHQKSENSCRLYYYILYNLFTVFIYKNYLFLISNNIFKFS